MANYVARVELHGALFQDYEKLHEEMKKRGYLKTIPANDGTHYDLPTGTYQIMNNAATLSQAFDAAKAAADATGKSSWIFVADWQNNRFLLKQT